MGTTTKVKKVYRITERRGWKTETVEYKRKSEFKEMIYTLDAAGVDYDAEEVKLLQTRWAKRR